MNRFVFGLLAFFFVAACSTQGQQTYEAAASGNYELEKTHAFFTWRISHNGLHKYTAQFTDFDAAINFDPDDPISSSVEATVNPLSVVTNHPTNEGWDEEIGRRFLKAGDFPTITFKSTRIERTGEFTGIVYGDLTFLGVTREVGLETTYNGTGNAPWFGTRDLIGFSATTTIKRSDFGLTALLPAIGDEVEIIIEAEFLEK